MIRDIHTRQLHHWSRAERQQLRQRLRAVEQARRSADHANRVGLYTQAIALVWQAAAAGACEDDDAAASARLRSNLETQSVLIEQVVVQQLRDPARFRVGRDDSRVII